MDEIGILIFKNFELIVGGLYLVVTAPEFAAYDNISPHFEQISQIADPAPEVDERGDAGSVINHNLADRLCPFASRRELVVIDHLAFNGLRLTALSDIVDGSDAPAVNIIAGIVLQQISNRRISSSA